MRSLLAATCACAFASLFLPSTLLADTVTVQNGDALNGEIVKVEKGKLHLKTTYAGTIQIDWAKVTNVESTARYEIEAETGRRYQGSIEREGAQLQVTEEDTTKPMDTADVVLMLRLKEDDTPPGFWKLLRGGLGLGYSLSRGNSNQTQASLTGEAGYRREKFDLHGDVSSIFSTLDEAERTERHALNARYDRYLSSRAFAFGLTGFERNDRQELDLRSRFGGGFGWKAIKGRDTQFDLLGGFTLTNEQFRDADNGGMLPRESTGEGLFGFEAETSKLFGVRLTTRLTAHPNLVQTGRYRIEYDSSAHVPLIAGFAWKVSLFDRYDSDPPRDGVQRNDYGMVSTFGVSF